MKPGCNISEVDKTDIIMGIDIAHTVDTSAIKIINNSCYGTGLGIYQGTIRQSNMGIGLSDLMDAMQEESDKSKRPYFVINDYPFKVELTEVTDSHRIFSWMNLRFQRKEFFSTRLEAEKYRLELLIPHYEYKLNNYKKTTHRYKKGFKQTYNMFNVRESKQLENLIKKLKRDLEKLEDDHPEWAF